MISKTKSANPEAVYYGGEYPQAGPLSQQAKSAGLNVPLMGGDGIYDDAFIELAGKTSEGDLATSVGAPTESLESAKQFVTDYKAAGYSEPYAAYGAYSYDAANAIINALKTSLASASDAKSARQATIDAMGKVSFDGATGKVAFDEYGDTTTKVWTAVQGRPTASGSPTRLAKPNASGGGACAKRSPPLVFSTDMQRGQASTSAPTAPAPPPCMHHRREG